MSLNYFQIYSFASASDIIFIISGIVGAIAAGSVLPIMTISLGDVLDAMVELSLIPVGSARESILFNDVTRGVVIMSILGVASFVSCYLQMLFFMISGENITKRIREKYFRSMLSQEIAWFDSASTGELTNRLTSDINIIQDGISDKVGLIFQCISAFLSGIVIGFVRGWKLTLVLSASLPLLSGAVYVQMKIMANASSEVQQQYAGAGSIAQQVFSAIRTVVSFGGENTEIKRYNEKLDEAEKRGIFKGVANGVGTGTFYMIMFLVYALAFWYGSILVRDGEMTAGAV